MYIENEFYILNSYNQNLFKVLIERQLSSPKGTEIDKVLIEQAISAMLLCIENGTVPDEVSTLERILEKNHICYQDFRYFSGTSSTGCPEDALKAFNRLWCINNNS